MNNMGETTFLYHKNHLQPLLNTRKDRKSFKSLQARLITCYQLDRRIRLTQKLTPCSRMRSPPSTWTNFKMQHKSSSRLSNTIRWWPLTNRHFHTWWIPTLALPLCNLVSKRRPLWPVPSVATCARLGSKSLLTKLIDSLTQASNTII